VNDIVITIVCPLGLTGLSKVEPCPPLPDFANPYFPEISSGIHVAKVSLSVLTQLNTLPADPLAA